MLAIKQEQQGLVIPAQAAVQTQQEVSVAVQRSLEASVCGGIITDESQLQGASPQQSLSPMIAPVSGSNPQTLGTLNRDISNDSLAGEGARPKDSVCLILYILDDKDSRLSQMKK